MIDRRPVREPGGWAPSLQRELFPWPHDPGDELYRADLSGVVAFVVCTPSYLVRAANPNGPGINLPEEHRLVVHEFAEQINRRLAEGLAADTSTHPVVQRYLPTVRQQRPAGAISDFFDLIQFFPTLSSAVQTLGGYVEVGRFLLDLGRWWKDRVGRGGEYIAEQDRLIFTAEAIRLMCAGHAHESYRVRPKNRPSAFVREGYFGSADHPTGREQYTVAVPSSRGTYVYVVDGRGTVFDHYLINRQGLHGLDLPDWFGDTEAVLKLRRPRQLDDQPPSEDSASAR